MYKEQKLVLNNLDSFELEDIFECGQCFRWNNLNENTYIGVIKQGVLKVVKQDNTVTFEGILDGDINSIVYEYFDLATDYSKLKEKLSKVDANMRKATTDHWYSVAIGTSEAHIDITLVNKDSVIGVELYISDNKELYDKLYENKDKIEEELGFNLEWRRLDSSKASRIIYHIKGLNFDDHSNYNDLMNKTIDIAVALRDTFRKYI